MYIQVGDRFTDAGFEWEVLTHPTAMHGARRCGRVWYGPASQRLSAM